MPDQFRDFITKAVARHEIKGAARRAEIERLETQLSADESVILVARPGLGKTYLAERVAERGRAAGRATVLIRCTRAADIRRLRALTPVQTAARELLIVDDAHLLGSADLRALIDIVSDPGRVCLVTLSSLPHTLDTVECREIHDLLTSLWVDHGLERIDLSGVGFTEAKAIIASISGHPGLDVALRARVISDSVGIPLLLAELTREAMNPASHYSRENTVLVLGPTVVSPRILDLTRSLLVDLSDAESYALITVAKLGTLPFMRAARLVGQAPLRALLRRGLVSPDPFSPESISACTLYASAALAGQAVDNPLESAHTVEKVLTADCRDGTPLSARECVVVATFWAAHPEINPLESVRSDVAASVFATAARMANTWDFPASAQVFAEQSQGLNPNILATLQLSRALAAQGHGPAALQVLEDDHLTHTVATEDEEMLTWWMTLLAQQHVDTAEFNRVRERVLSWGTINDAVENWDLMQSASARLATTNDDASVDALLRVAEGPHASLAMRLRAINCLLPVFAHAGRHTELARVIRDGRKLMSLARSVPGSVGEHAQDVSAAFIALAGICRAQSGFDRARLADDLDAYALRAVSSRDATELAFVNLASGYLALDSTDPSRAVLNFTQSEARIGRIAPPFWLSWVTILRSHALAVLGQRAEATARSARLPEVEIAASPLLRYSFETLQIWLNYFAGDVTTARSGALVLAAAEGPRSRLLALRCLHFALAAGEPAETVVEHLDALPAPSNTERTELQAVLEEHLRAAAASDGFRLDSVGRRFIELRFVWEADVAFRAAHQAHCAEGSAAEATASRVRAVELRSSAVAGIRVLDTMTDETGPAGCGNLDAFGVLTRRELEVARLAGAGLSNSDIAGRLFISVRTVESHVLHARVKLGVTRAELGAHVGSLHALERATA